MWIVSILGALLNGCLIGVTIGTVMAAIMVWRYVSAIAQEERLRLLGEAEQAFPMEHLLAAQTDDNVAATGTGIATPEDADFDFGEELPTEASDESPANSRHGIPDGAGDSGDGQGLSDGSRAPGSLSELLRDLQSGTRKVRDGAGEDATSPPANE